MPHTAGDGEGDALRASSEPDDTIGPALVTPHPPIASPASATWSWGQLWALTGTGGAISAAFIDPQALELDLQLGAYTKYALLYVLVLTTAVSIGVQVLAARLGANARKHLAELCRAEYMGTFAFGFWLLLQAAIVVRNAQHVASTAQALRTLVHVPMGVGCAGVAATVLLLLSLRGCDDPRARFPGARAVEMVFLCLLSMLGILCVAALSASEPNGWEMMQGLISPTVEWQNIRRIITRWTLVVVPFNVFLHSALTSQCSLRSRIMAAPTVMASPTRGQVQRRQHRLNVLLGVETTLALAVTFLIHGAVVSCFGSALYSPQCANLSKPGSPSSLVFTSIQTTCVPIRTALDSHKPVYDAFSGNVCKFRNAGNGMGATEIGATAGCTACQVDRPKWLRWSNGKDESVQDHRRGYCQEIDLSDAGRALREAVGEPIQVVWALSVLVSGLLAALATTLAGEFVLQGFFGFSRAPGIRRPMAQAVTIIPGAFLAATIVGEGTPSLTWQNVLYTLPALVLPLTLIALLSFTNSGVLMTPRFANSKFSSRILLLCVALLSSLQLGFIYDRLAQAKVHPGVAGWIAIGVAGALYCAMLLYAVLCYRSTSDRERSRQEEDDAQMREPLLADDEVAV